MHSSEARRENTDTEIYFQSNNWKYFSSLEILEFYFKMLETINYLIAFVFL